MHKPGHVVVIGAGLAGLTTAYYLQREGVQVTVIDRSAGPGRETSYANGALLHPSLVEPWNSPGVFWQLLRWVGRENAPVLLRPRAWASLLGWGPQFIRQSTAGRFRANTQKNLRLAIYSLRLMHELRTQTSISYEYQARGLLAVFRDDETQSQLRSGADALSASGMRVRHLDRRALLTLEPALSPIGDQLIGGIHYQDDEGGDAHLFCKELARLLEEGGAELRFGVAVDAIRSSRDRVDHLVCAGRTVSADAYVLAAGSYTPLLARQAALSIPVRPAKGYSITMPRALAPSAAPRIGVLDARLHAVVVPVGEDRVRVAGTAEFAGYDLSINPKRVANLRLLLRQIFPLYEHHVREVDVDAWTGLRPMASDGVPILGVTRCTNLYLNTGHGHLGWTLAAGSGRLVTDLILRRKPALPAPDYALDR